MFVKEQAQKPKEEASENHSDKKYGSKLKERKREREEKRKKEERQRKRINFDARV